MFKITAAVEGMMCGMCEAHASDAVRNNFQVKKVTSSHKSKTVEIITEEDISRESLEAVIKSAGYTLTEFEKVPYEKKGLFAFAKK